MSSDESPNKEGRDLFNKTRNGSLYYIRLNEWGFVSNILSVFTVNVYQIGRTGEAVSKQKIVQYRI